MAVDPHDPLTLLLAPMGRFARLSTLRRLARAEASGEAKVGEATRRIADYYDRAGEGDVTPGAIAEALHELDKLSPGLDDLKALGRKLKIAEDHPDRAEWLRAVHLHLMDRRRSAATREE